MGIVESDDNIREKEWGVPDGPPPQFELPFGQRRRREAGEWIYDNRETICITVIVYLVAAVILLSWRIALNSPQADPPVIVAFEESQELQRLEEELRRAQELNDMLNAVGPQEPVKNVVSNENAEDIPERLSEETREIYERSQEALQEMDRNGSEYEQMLASLSEAGREEAQTQEYRDAKVEGGVTVSFSLANPLRHAVNLPVPSYKCPGGGTVVVDIVVSRNGDVLSAGIDKARSASDGCMTEAALEMARRSRFSVNQSAPGRHLGTITYVFVPQ